MVQFYNMSLIEQKCRKLDILAARFYKLAERDRPRAARDWLNEAKKVAELVKQAQKCRKKSTSNKGFLRVPLKNVENVTEM